MKKTMKKTSVKRTAKKLPAVIDIPPAEIIRDLVLQGNISKMSPDEKVRYYTSLCKSLGLNPLTQPFQILVLQSRETLYATKTATEQLRKIYGVSVDKIEQRIDRDIIISTVTVHDKTGRTDGATGAVNIKGLSGDGLANALMKSETKAKRRATLSICGLGMLDETEIETIPGATTNNIFVSAPQIDRVSEPVDNPFDDSGLKLDPPPKMEPVKFNGNLLDKLDFNSIVVDCAEMDYQSIVEYRDALLAKFAGTMSEKQQVAFDRIIGRALSAKREG